MTTWLVTHHLRATGALVTSQTHPSAEEAYVAAYRYLGERPADEVECVIHGPDGSRRVATKATDLEIKDKYAGWSN